MTTHEDHHELLLLIVTKSQNRMKMPPVEVIENLLGRFCLIHSADLGIVALWPMIFLFSRLIALARVLDFLILEAASGWAGHSRFVFSLERISIVETQPTMVAASIIFCSSLQAVSQRMLDMCTWACKILMILLDSRSNMAMAGHLADILLVQR